MLNPLLTKQLQQLDLDPEKPPNSNEWSQLLANLNLVLTNQLSAVNHDKIQASANNHVEQVLLINKIITSGTNSENVQEILTQACKELAKAFDSPQVAAALLNEDKTALVVKAEYLDAGRPTAMGVVIPNNERTKEIINSFQPQIIHHPLEKPSPQDIRDLMIKRKKR